MMSKQTIADGATVVAHGAAGWAWLVQVNEILTAIATLIAITSGVYAIRYYSKKKDEPEEPD